MHEKYRTNKKGQHVCEVLLAPRPHLDPEPGGKEPATRAARMQLPPAALTMRAAARRKADEAEASERAAWANASVAEAFILQRALESADLPAEGEAATGESAPSLADLTS